MPKNTIRDLSEEELEFYSRQIVLKEIGYTGQLKLRDAKVCIVGLGGLGCTIATQLAAMGIGHLRLIDRDVVELSNLQRQHLYGVKFLGYPKVEAASKRLKDLNPHIELEPLTLSLNENNADEILREVDVVVDGLDQMKPRYAINRACVKHKIPYVFGAAIMTFGNVSTVIPGETPCLECFHGNVDDETLPTCAVMGVHPSVLGVVSSIEVAEAVTLLLGKQPRLAGVLLNCDIEYLSFEEIRISKFENCPVCSSKPIGSPMPLKQELIEKICGRGGRKTFIITPKRNLELGIESLYEFLDKSGFSIKVKADLGITFHHGYGGTGSILKSGIMIVEGIADKEGAFDLYNRIVIDGLGVSQTNVK
jgi:adenylyltransferase/sulfurtransferase